MNTITQNAINAFLIGTEFKQSNMKVYICDNGQRELFLFDNLIATYNKGVLSITDAEYKTVTTKERLNGLLSKLNLDCISQRKKMWYIGSKTWNGSTSFNVTLKGY